MNRLPSYAVLPAVQLGDGPTWCRPPWSRPTPRSWPVAGLLGGWLARRAATRVDVREQLRQLG